MWLEYRFIPNHLLRADEILNKIKKLKGNKTMTKPVNILNDYELKAIVMSDKFDFNNFYKYELGKMINILKEEIKRLNEENQKLKGE